MSRLTILPGTRVCSHHGEQDLDHNGRERKTGTNAWGVVTGLNHTDDHGLRNWDVVFGNGTWVVITTLELKDPDNYALYEPDDAESILVRIGYWVDEKECCYLDDNVVTLVQQLLDQRKDLIEEIRAGKLAEAKFEAIKALIDD